MCYIKTKRQFNTIKNKIKEGMLEATSPRRAEHLITRIAGAELVCKKKRRLTYLRHRFAGFKSDFPKVDWTKSLNNRGDFHLPRPWDMRHS